MNNAGMNRIIRLCIMILLYDSVLCKAADPWTWQLKKIFNQAELQNSKHKQSLIFAKYDLPHFSQLIFSWNAYRPRHGYFRFFVQVRDAASKKWHDWHKMIDWGSQIQRSYFKVHEGKTTYHHVRLEMSEQNLADAIRIKIVSQEGADLSSIKALFVCISNLNNFEAESVHSLPLHKLKSIYIPKVPQQSQMVLDHPKKDALCSTTSSTIVASFCAGKKFDPLEFAAMAYDDGLEAYGSWPFNTAHAFELCNGSHLFHVTRLESFVALHKKLQKNIPVVVSVRGPLKGAPSDYAQGHLLVVVGWNHPRKKILCHDPAFESTNKTYVEYDLKSFLEAWERSRRLAYLAEPNHH